jgi:hypothetical protein
MAALTVSAIPALISLAFLWWNGHLAWVCWIVAFVSVLAYGTARFTLFWRDGLMRGQYADVQAFRGWELIGSIVMWVQWVVCFTAIVLAFIL